MTREQIIEAMQPLDDIATTDGFCDWADVANARDECIRRLFFIPGLSDVIEGKAVVVPREPNEAQVRCRVSPILVIGNEQNDRVADWRRALYREMICLSPYTKDQP